MATRPVLFDPPDAIAVSICIAARSLGKGLTSRHPRPCGWCDYELPDLESMLRGFNAWAGYDERAATYDRLEARAFQGLPARVQAEQVLAAQSFPEAAPAVPMADLEPAAAHDTDDEEGPTWAT